MAGDRAKVVCVHCHARKVKCDLELRSGGICYSCQKHGLICKPRQGLRPTVRQRHSSVHDMPSRQSVSTFLQQPLQSPTSNQSYLSQANVSDSQEGEIDDSATAETPSPHAAYIGDSSFLLDLAPSLPLKYRKVVAFSESVKAQLLKITSATTIPPKVMLKASNDSYFQYVFHRIPVVDPEDILGDRPSPLLCQAVCLIGSMMRHPKGPISLVESDHFYVNVKSLLFVNHDEDFLTALKALCLLMTWNVIGPTVLTFDCSWHWLGVATRLLFQMGLHREAACARSSKPGCTRRIAWSLFVQDKLLAAAFGRPASINAPVFNVRPLELGDFESSDNYALNRKSVLFIEYAKLASILSRLLDLQTLSPENPTAEFLAILESLKDWIRNIPEGNRLYDPLGVRVYWRDVYEIHILYFVIIITYFHLRGQNNPFSAASIASLVASSCIARLYEEINYRDDINYLLGLNNWFLMVASVPQLLYNAGVSLYGQDKLCTEELDILVASLEQMEIKWPGATIVLNVVVRLRNSQKLASIPISQPFVAPEAAWDEETEISALRDLFPFPSSLSPRMSLLDYDADDLRYPAVGEVGQPFDENLNWIFSEFTELSYRQSFVDGHNLFSPGC